MSLQFIIGNSGSGKSYHLYKDIIRQSIEHPHRNYLVIVPEQFTMQTQKDLVCMHPNKGIMNIDVLSFQRLAYRIFEEVGASDKILLEDTGKSLILRKIAGEKQEELGVLGRNLRKTGYISEIKSVISELTQYSIGAEELDTMLKVSSGRPGLNRKLEDIKVIYEGFQSYLEDRYITTEEVLDVLSTVIDKSQIIRNAVIALDGFTGFTPVQNKLMEQLVRYADKVVVSVTADTSEDVFGKSEDYHLFHMSKETISGLKRIAEEAEVAVDKEIMIRDKSVYRFRESQALGFLEQNMFRYRNRIWEGIQEEISIHEVMNPREECEFIAREIRNLVREKGYRYKDIAIVTGDIEGYAEHISRVFRRYQIPCFLDHKRSIMMNPFVEFIRAAIDMADRNFDYESTFRFLRCGMTGIPADDLDMLENYVLALGIRGRKKWNEKWVRSYRGLSTEELDRVNGIREIFVNGVQDLTVVLKGRKKTAQEYTRALYEFIVQHDIQVKLKVYEEQFQESGELGLAREYGQIYRIVMELFDKIADLIGDEVIPLTEYKEILDAGFEEAKVGVIPPSMDQVVTGDIQRTRLKDIKALFFAGVNDGIIPRSDGGGGVISELDREFLADNEIRLAPTMRENSYIQKFYLYLNMTKPTNHLYLSYSRVSSGGDTLRPSYLIRTMRQLFPDMPVQDEDVCEQIADRVGTPGSSVASLIEGLQDAKEDRMSNQWKELFSWFNRSEEWKGRLRQLVDAAYTSYSDTALGRAVARALYGSVLENSVTRLEKFAECAFAHFMQYGLHLSEREEYSFAAMDLGNVFHKALEVFSKKLEESAYDWTGIPDEVREQFLEESVEESVLDYGNTVLYSTARNQYMIQRIRRMVSRTVWALSEQIKRGRFKPAHYEVSFAMEDSLEAVNITLSEEEKMRLRGRIDRMDTYEQEEQVYVKVIDYKSGNKDFDIVALYYGLQLQLVVYLNAAMELAAKEHQGKQVVPAGVFYYNVKDPVVDKGGDEQEIQEKLLQELRMKGLVNSDPEVVSYMDADFTGSSAVLPVSKLAKGNLRKSDSLISDRQFGYLSDYVQGKMKEIGERIMQGEVSVNPFELGGETACRFCDYNGICGFDKKIPGYEVRRLKSYKAQDIWENLEEGE